MDELKKYTSDDVLSMAEAVANDLVAGIFTMEQLTDTLTQLIFRDEAGSYWTTVPRDQKWYRFITERWDASDSPSSTMEGLASIAMWAPSVTETSSATETEFNGKRDSSALEFIENMIRGISESYSHGEITTITAHALASQVFLINQDDHFWTSGLSSGKWYYFDTEQWHMAKNPPPLETLVDTQDPEKVEALDKKVIEFLVAMDGALPEPITEPWDPPTLLPEPILQCPSCSRLDVGHHTQCNFCQADLPVSAPPEQKTAKFCTHCGHEQPQQMIFCVQCGKKF